MRFLHIADVHLGAVPERGTELGKIRAAEIYRTFYRIVARCEEEDVDLLLIAGDLFHRAPLLRELKEVNYRFGQLSRTKVVLIAGNHDYIGAHSNYRDFVWADNVVMLESDKMESVYFEEINTRVYGFSYHTKDFPLPAGWESSVRLVSEQEISVLMLHGGEPDKVPFDRKKLAAAAFDYAALGHIHTGHERILPRGAYAGSLEPLDKNETGEHGYYAGELWQHGGELSLRFVPASTRRYIRIEQAVTPDMTNGEISDLCAAEIARCGEEHIYHIRLSGRRDAQMLIDREILFSLGIVIEVVDDTRPDFDMDALEEENRDNVIGMYIRGIRAQGLPAKEEERALIYGVEALFHAGRKS